MKQNNVTKISIPAQLPNILKSYCKAILENNPTNIVQFSRKYFFNLLQQTNKQKEGTQDFYLLKDYEDIRKLLFAPVKYLWLDQNIFKEEFRTQIDKIKKKIDIQFFDEFNKLKQVFFKSQNVSFRIITSIQLKSQVYKQFKANRKLQNIHIYSKNQKEIDKIVLSLKIRSVSSNIDELITNIRQKSLNQNFYMGMPNFLKITTKQNAEDNTNINKIRYNLRGLLKFTNRRQAKRQFIKLAKFLFSQKDKIEQIQQFQKEFPIQGQSQIVLQWYTKETFYYGFLNNFLRSQSDPEETPYIRFPFRRTYQVIKQSYIKSQKTSFKVFRKATFDHGQLNFISNNIGQYIEIFGFMSTSLKYEVTENFFGNTLIIIEVDESQKQQDMEQGYVKIVGSNFDEEQILFNVFNIFKIVDFKQDNNLNTISLKYGELARLSRQRKLHKISEKEQNIIINIKHQQQVLKKIQDQGQVFYFSQNYKKSGQYLLKTIAKQNEESKSNKGIIAKKLNELGMIQKAKSNHQKALQYFYQVYDILASMFPNQNNTTNAVIINNIAQVHYLKGNYQKALQYYRKSQTILLKCGGQNNPSTALVYTGIALVYSKKADFAKSLEYYVNAYKIYVKVYGQNHYNVATVLTNIAVEYFNLQLIDKSIQYYERALTISKNTLGQNHTNTISIMLNLATAYNKNSRFDQSLKYYKISYQLSKKIYGQKNFQTVTALIGIANVQSQKNQYDSALQKYQNALEVYKTIFGQNHQNTATLLANIGQLYRKQEQYKYSIQYFEKSLKIYQTAIGENHPTTYNIICNIGLIYENMKQFEKALQYLKRWYKLQKSDENSQSYKAILRKINDMQSMKKTRQ